MRFAPVAQRWLRCGTRVSAAATSTISVASTSESTTINRRRTRLPGRKSVRAGILSRTAGSRSCAASSALTSRAAEIRRRRAGARKRMNVNTRSGHRRPMTLQLQVRISSPRSSTARRRCSGRKRALHDSHSSDASASPTAYGASRGSSTERPLRTARATRRRRPRSSSSHLTSRESSVTRVGSARPRVRLNASGG